MSEAKMFKLRNGVTLDTVCSGVERYLQKEKNLYVDILETAEGYFIQAKEPEGWKKLAGLDQATQIQLFKASEDTITVNVGSGKWVDKAAAAGVGAIVFAPLMATAAFGAYKQKKLPTEIFTFIERFILSDGESIVVTPTNSSTKEDQHYCPECQAKVEQGAKFCANCGTNLANMVKTCANCQAELKSSTKFCPECGTAVNVN